MSIKFIHN